RRWLLAQVASRMAALIVEVIDGILSPLAQGLMQPGNSLRRWLLAQVASRMAALIVEVIDGILSPLAQGLMQ
ncbi:hypothetical protein C7D74_33310, partial [Klebsiella pneumoniae]